MNTIPDLDTAIAAWLDREAPESAPSELWPRALQRIRETRQRRRWRLVAAFQSAPPMTRAAIAAGMVAAVALGASVLLFNGGGVGDDSASPSSTPTASAPGGSVSPELVKGWPTGRTGPAGLYSWDMESTRWMHHVAGLGEVALTFTVPPDGTARIEGTPVSIGGFPGIHQEGTRNAFGSLSEYWDVQIEDTLVQIHLEADADAPASLIDEARAVIESIERRPRYLQDGFRLVFRLPAGWDSG
jgi:hypothetical protein